MTYDKKTQQLNSLLRSKIHKYINTSLINYNLQSALSNPVEKDLVKEIKETFTPEFSSTEKINSLLSAFNESSKFTIYKNNIEKKALIENDTVTVTGSNINTGSWNFNQISKDDIQDIENQEVNEIPDDVSENDRRILKAYIQRKSTLLKSIFISNRERNKIKDESKDLCEINEILLDKYLSFDSGVVLLNNIRTRYDDIRLISEDIREEALNDINFMYIHMDDYWTNESSYIGKWSKLFGKDYSINKKQKLLVDEFIDSFIKKTDDEFRTKTKNFIISYIESLSKLNDYFEKNKINIEDSVKEAFELVDEFYDSHVTLLENTKKLSDINYNLELLNKELTDKQKEINKILDSYAIKDSEKKLKEKIEASLNGLDNEKLLKDLNDLFNNNTLSLEDSIDFIIAEILQSITTSPMTSNEIIDFMLTHKELLGMPPDLREDNVETDHDKIKILTNITGIDKQSLFIKKEVVGSNGKFNNRFGLLKKDYSRTDGVFDLNEIIYGNDESDDGNVTRITPNIQNGKFNKICPLMSYFMILDPTFRVGKKNELELSVFLNSLSTIELSKSTPYFNATFILPNEVTKSGKTYKTASITQFLNGTKINNEESSDSKSVVFNGLNQTIMKNNVKGIKSNMNLFTMPQTLNNFDDMYVGRNSSEEREIIKKISGYERANYIHDITRPFMTLKSFSIDVAPTQGLLSFKTGKVSLVIHDRTRMVDIAPFIKPDMFGVIGAELILSYGWSNIAANAEENYIGNFINSMKTTEKYVITNSSFNITKNGEVNVDLSIAMKGPIDIKKTMLTSDANAELNISRLKSSYNEIVKLKNKLRYPAGSSSSQYLDIKEDLTEDINLSAISGKSSTDFITSVLNGSLNSYKSLIDSLAILNTTTKDYYDKLKKQIPSQDKNQELENFKNNFESNFLIYLRNYFPEKTFYLTSTNISLHPDDFSIICVDLLTNYHDFFSILKELIDVILKKDTKTKKLVSKIMKGTENIDPFFDKEWSRDFRNVVIGGDQSQTTKITHIGTNINSKADILKDNVSNYISLGMIISSLLGVHLTKSGNYDDIQIVSYNVNKKAGLMSNRNISSLLIPKKDLNELISEILNSRKSISIEGILSRIIQEFVATRNQVTYGLSDLSIDSSKKSAYNTHIDERLLKIDSYLNKNTDKGPRIIEFQMPKIKMLFDSFVKKDDIDKTIIRITLYDDNDNPYKELSNMFTENNELLQYASQINRIKLSKGKKSKELKDKSVEIFNKLLNSDPPLIEKRGDKYVFVNEGNIVRAKKEIKKLVPSVTYGTQNSGIIDANVTTVNEGNLNAVFMTRGERETGDLKGLKVSSDIDFPLQILPSKASITMFGCPFVSFAQYMFLDFETNTTIDNFYAVTGINHNLSPGNFTTSLTLSYGDAYGKYISSINTLQNTFNDLFNGTIKGKTKITVNRIIQDLSDFNIKNKTNVYFETKINNIEQKIKSICKTINFVIKETIKSNKAVTLNYSSKEISYEQYIVSNGKSKNIIGEHLGSILLCEDQKQSNTIKMYHVIFRTESVDNINLIDDYEIDIDIEVD